MTTFPMHRREPIADVDGLRRRAAAAGLDAIVAHSPRNVFYLSNYHPFDALIEPESIVFAVLPVDPRTPAAVTIPMSERYVLEDFATWMPQRVHFGAYYVKGGPDRGEPAPSSVDALGRVLRESGLEEKRVGFELALLPVAARDRIAAAHPDMTIGDASPLLAAARQIKTPVEIERLRIVAKRTEEAIDVAFARLAPGVTEREVAKWILAELIARDLEPVYVQLGAGPRGPHGTSYPTDRVLARGDVVRTDVAAAYGLYHSDLGRCAAIGEATAEQRALYRVSMEAVEMAIATSQPGTPASEIFAKTVAVPANAGYTDFRRHHVGHGIGLQAHEPPFLKPSVTDPIAPGMVLALEAPYYVWGVGGFSPEDMIVVTEHGHERLSKAPHELPIIG